MKKSIYILGICGTFMGGVAQLAKAAGFEVGGCDVNIYPPMSDQLQQAGIQIDPGFEIAHLPANVDCVLVGNAISRGNVLLEYILERQIPYQNAPLWLYEQILRHKWVLAVAGTHGKTSSSAMLTWVLEYAGLNPSYLIGGVAQNFAYSARLTDSPFFVIEADEYDSAFNDKRSKFIHYTPKTLIINNLEFDHADIFKDIGAIQWQFAQLLRTMSAGSKVVYLAEDENIQTALKMGSYCPLETFSSRDPNAEWQARDIGSDFRQFAIYHHGQLAGQINWQQMGAHNVQNALGVVAASAHIGVLPTAAIAALNQFTGVKRRMERLAEVQGVTVYDDFAHHPSAIATTIHGLRQHIGSKRLLAVCEPRSNTMKMGVHQNTLLPALAGADLAWLYLPEALHWVPKPQPNCRIFADFDALVADIVQNLAADDHLLIMSNGSFNGIHQQIIAQLNAQKEHRA